MSSIAVAGGTVTLVSEEDFAFLSAFKWHLSPARYVATRQRVTYPDGAVADSRYMHRICDRTPKGVLIDHANGDTLDNRRVNLRRCTRAQNAMNKRRVDTLSGFKGVVPYREGRWKAQLYDGGRNIYLGIFDTSAEAAAAYDSAALAHFGEFAATNHSLGLL